MGDKMTNLHPDLRWFGDSDYPDEVWHIFFVDEGEYPPALCEAPYSYSMWIHEAVQDLDELEFPAKPCPDCQAIAAKWKELVK